MNIFSLFEEEKLAKILVQVIKKKRPKSDLEKTQWWNFIISQSLVDENVRIFIKHIWPKVEPKNILHHLSEYNDKEVKIHRVLKEALVDKKLIEIIKKEQVEILLKKALNIPANGPTPKSKKINTTTKGKINCVATLEGKSQDVAYENIYDFLIDLSCIWIKGLEKGSPEINCSNQINEEKDDEIAEIIFSNFPKTFNYCEKDYHLYICGWNWNLTKEQP